MDRRDPYDNMRNSTTSYPQLGTKRPIIPEVSASVNYKSGNSNPGLSVMPVGQTGRMDHAIGHSMHSGHSGHSSHSSHQPSTSKRQKKTVPETGKNSRRRYPRITTKT